MLTEQSVRTGKMSVRSLTVTSLAFITNDLHTEFRVYVLSDVIKLCVSTLGKRSRMPASAFV